MQAGLEILDRQGRSALTLRACAAHAGVSHAAPAHHFSGLAGLLGAIAKEGYQIFTAFMVEAREKAKLDPRAQLVAICDGYLAFSRAHPGLFQLMFNAGQDIEPNPELIQTAERAYAELAHACAPFEPVQSHPQSTEIMVWSLIHGLACLLQGGQFRSPDASQPTPTIDDILPMLTLRKQT